MSLPSSITHEQSVGVNASLLKSCDFTIPTLLYLQFRRLRALTHRQRDEFRYHSTQSTLNPLKVIEDKHEQEPGIQCEILHATP